MTILCNLVPKQVPEYQTADRQLAPPSGVLLSGLLLHSKSSPSILQTQQQTMPVSRTLSFREHMVMQTTAVYAAQTSSRQQAPPACKFWRRALAWMSGWLTSTLSCIGRVLGGTALLQLGMLHSSGRPFLPSQKLFCQACPSYLCSRRSELKLMPGLHPAHAQGIMCG